MAQTIPQTLIIGGYGTVGSLIAKHLTQALLPVTIAGRSEDKARSLAAQLGPLANGTAFDSRDLAQLRAGVPRYGLVINCVDQPDTRLLETIIRHGNRYLDVTADVHFLRQARALHLQAKQLGAALLLGLGLVPGLANIMAKAARNQVGAGADITTSVLLSLADQHGDLALSYMLKALAERYEASGEDRFVQSFGEARISDFPPSLGPRRAHRFPLPGQFFYPETLQARTASTWLALEPSWSANALAGLSRLGLAPLLKAPSLQPVVLPLLKRLPLGKTQAVYALMVEGAAGERRARFFVQGNEEAAVTALVVSLVAEAVIKYTLMMKPGVWLPEQILEPPWLFANLGRHGITVQELDPKAEEVASAFS